MFCIHCPSPLPHLTILSSVPGCSWMSTILQHCSGKMGNLFLMASRMISGVIVFGTCNSQVFVPISGSVLMIFEEDCKCWDV